ncbi:MAG: hypothetical protein IRZ13_19400 [Acetobacteraceae bacterium]|nr:hypothetical protein [Acetobacteraceae bacterium]
MVGGAPRKLLITSRRSDCDAFDRFVEAVAAPAVGTVYVAYIPSYASGTEGAGCWFEPDGQRPSFLLTRFADGRRSDFGEDTGAGHRSGARPEPE